MADSAGPVTAVAGREDQNRNGDVLTNVYITGGILWAPQNVA